MTLYMFLCDNRTCQECFSRELVGEKFSFGVDEGELILLRNFDEGTQYGPFRATDSQRENIEPDAWNGRYPHQVPIEWGDLYRISDSESPFPTEAETDMVSGADEDEVLQALRERGTPIDVADNGEIETDVDDPGDPPEPDDDDDRVGDESVTAIIQQQGREGRTTVRDRLEAAAEPGNVLLRSAVSGELRPELYREALAHLVAGKNLVFFGPPGSGKTRAAERLGNALCSRLRFATANAEWTHHEVVGGYRPAESSFEPKEGVLTAAAKGCEASLREHELPAWLVIDEINRANLDQAFGDVFSLLDLTHRDDTALTYAGDEGRQAVPLSFRVLATMNTEDRAQLFSLGYAFRRRFAFVRVPSLFAPPETAVTAEPPTPSVTDVDLERHTRQTRLVLERAAVDRFRLEPVVESDTPLTFPVLAALFDADAVLEQAVQALGPAGNSADFVDAILSFVETLVAEDIAEIGQGIVIDAIAYVMASVFLFPESTDWGVVDEAVVAYIVPQLDAFTSELRRAETVATESDAIERFEDAITAAERLGFPSTANRLRTGLREHRLF